MGAGRGATQADETHGGAAAPENARSGLLYGLSLRQTVLVSVIAYAVLMAVFLGKDVRSPKAVIVPNNENLSLNFQAQKASVLGEDELLQELQESISNDDPINSSELPIALAGDHKSSSEQGWNPEDDLYYELRTNLYHSSVVFQMNYEEMLLKFKIFVYPGDKHSFKVLPDGTESEVLWHTDNLFVHQLYQSDFVTLDPEIADLLFLPISIRSLTDDSQIGPERIGKYLNKYVQSIRDGYPFWSRTLGADHVVVICHEAKEDGSRNVLELKKNAIQVACSQLAGGGSQSFFPHKDVAMPLHQYVPIPAGADAEGERFTLVYYSGLTDPSSLYASLGVSWESDSSFAFESRDVERAVHYRRLATSKFCLILGPQDYGDIVNSLRFGCVPVLVSDGKLYDLPFQDILNWNKFSVIVSSKILKKLKSFLSAFNEQEYVTLQFLAKEASKHMEWHTPPQNQDAFYMVLYDLWIRRHVIRYVRRDEF